MRLARIIVLLAAFWVTGEHSTLFGLVPLQLEPDYAEAILAYHDKDYREVLRILGPLILQEATSEELMELAALALKNLGQEKKSEVLFRKIIEVMKKRGSPPSEIASYEFELGVILFRAKRWKEAHPLLQNAVASKFNETPARFFLGIVSMERKEWAAAEKHFTKVSQSKNLELRLTSHLYMAQVHAATQAQARMVRDYVTARSDGLEELKRTDLTESEKEVVNGVIRQATQALRPLKSDRYFGYFGLITSYDTNVFSDATSIVLSGGSKKASLKQSLLASLGYTSPLLSDWQVVFNYKGSGNKNFNEETLDGQFLQNEMNFFLNHVPLEEVSYGVKIAGASVFQFVGSSSRFEPYLLQFGGGPYLRYYLGGAWVFAAQGGFLFRNQNTDSTLAESFHRSGTEQELKLSVQNDTRATYFNPSVELAASLRNTSGAEFRSKLFQLDVSNTSYLSPVFQLIQAVSVAKVLYGDREEGGRDDLSLTLRLGGTVRLLGNLHWINDVQFISNASNVTLYEFSRNVYSTGLTWNF